MISAILLIYVGTEIGAPWWYFGLIALQCLWKVFSAGAETERGDDRDYYGEE